MPGPSGRYRPHPSEGRTATPLESRDRDTARRQDRGEKSAGKETSEMLERVLKVNGEV